MNLTVTLKGDLDPAGKMAQAIGQRRYALQQEVQATSFSVYAKWRSGVRVRSRRYRNSIKRSLGSQDGLSVRIHTNVKYAPDEEFGTRPHTIRPKNGEYLRFEIGGKVIFAKEVRHPGTRGSYARRNAVESERGPFLARITKALETGVV